MKQAYEALFYQLHALSERADGASSEPHGWYAVLMMSLLFILNLATALVVTLVLLDIRLGHGARWVGGAVAALVCAANAYLVYGVLGYEAVMARQRARNDVTQKMHERIVGLYALCTVLGLFLVGFAAAFR